MPSFAEQMLLKVESLLLGKVDKDAQSYTVAGRSITKMPITELVQLRDKLKAEVEQEKIKAALDAKGIKRVRGVRYV